MRAARLGPIAREMLRVTVIVLALTSWALLAVIIAWLWIARGAP